MVSAMKDVLFADQGLVDNRQALFSFAIPGVEGQWGFFPPTLAPWRVLAIVSLSLQNLRDDMCFSRQSQFL